MTLPIYGPYDSKDNLCPMPLSMKFDWFFLTRVADTGLRGCANRDPELNDLKSWCKDNLQGRVLFEDLSANDGIDIWVEMWFENHSDVLMFKLAKGGA